MRTSSAPSQLVTHISPAPQPADPDPCSGLRTLRNARGPRLNTPPDAWAQVTRICRVAVSEPVRTASSTVPGLSPVNVSVRRSRTASCFGSGGRPQTGARLLPRLAPGQTRSPRRDSAAARSARHGLRRWPRPRPWCSCLTPPRPARSARSGSAVASRPPGTIRGRPGPGEAVPPVPAENRTRQRALSTGDNPHTGEQFLTGGTEEDLVEVLRAGRLRPRTMTLGPEPCRAARPSPPSPRPG